MNENEELTAKSLTMSRLKLMNYGGSNPLNRTRWNRFRSLSHVILTGLVSFLMILNSLFTKHETVSSFTEANLMLFAFIQISAKCATCHTQGQTIINLLKIVWNDFRPIEDLQPEPKNKMLRYYRLIRLAAHSYFGAMICALSLYTIQATIKTKQNERGLVMDIWIPRKEILKITPYYECVYVFEVLLFMSSTFLFLVPLDTLFIILIGLVYTQFKLLKMNLNQIVVDQSFERLKQCVEHHDMLMRFLNKLDAMYSVVFLPSIGSNLCLLTLTMYGVVSGDTTTRQVAFVFISSATFFQLFCYCIVGDLIQDEALSIAQTVYESNWIDLNDRKIGRGLFFIMVRAQRKVNLSVGGIMILNMENFSGIVRSAFSFLTFIVNMRSK